MSVAKNITYSLVLIVTAAHFEIPSSATDLRFPSLKKKIINIWKVQESKNIFLFINLANGVSGKPKKKSVRNIFFSISLMTFLSGFWKGHNMQMLNA